MKDPDEKSKSEMSEVRAANQKELIGEQETKFTPSLAQVATIINAVMITLGGLSIMYNNSGQLNSILQLPADLNGWQEFGIIAVSALMVLQIFSYLAESWLPSFAFLCDDIRKQYSKETLLSLLYISIISALGEEILFRAAIVPEFGIVGASLLSSAVVLLFSGSLLSLVIWNFLLAILLSWIFDSTSWLALTLCIHICHNLLTILRIRLKSDSIVDSQVPLPQEQE